MIRFFISVFGLCLWAKDDTWHNNNGWAIQHNAGKESYFINGIPHCVDGPALITYNGPQYYIHGVKYESEFEYWIAVQLIANSS